MLSILMLVYNERKRAARAMLSILRLAMLSTLMLARRERCCPS